MNVSYKKAFTMIELIFVIVIIGILAAVAVPKLAATRDDAKISALANSIVNAAHDIAAHTISQAETTTDFTEMSDAVKSMIQHQDAVQDGNVLKIKMNNVSDCLKLQVVTSALDSNLTINYGDAGNDKMCQALQQIIPSEDYPIPLGGSRIKR